jgi:hypothetical protein
MRRSVDAGSAMVIIMAILAILVVCVWVVAAHKAYQLIAKAVPAHFVIGRGA